MTDFTDTVGGLESPALTAAAITPSNSTNFTQGVCRGIYVGGAGAVMVVFNDDAAVAFAAVPVGTTLCVRAKRVNATGTTATNLVALY